jgi:hypothetical protein
VAGEIDPVRIVDDTIEDGVGVGGIADQLVCAAENGSEQQALLRLIGTLVEVPPSARGPSEA